MSGRSGINSIACGFTLFAVTAVIGCAPALSQTADLALCDRVAADPADPDKPKDVAGVAEIASGDIATAIKYCKVAAGK